MTESLPNEDSAEGPECLVAGCGGRMTDVQPVESARSDDFVLIRIECSRCGARAWRILRPSEPEPRV